MIYSEATYFQGFHFAHIAAYEEAKRLHNIRQRNGKLLARMGSAR